MKSPLRPSLAFSRTLFAGVCAAGIVGGSFAAPGWAAVAARSSGSSAPVVADNGTADPTPTTPTIPTRRVPPTVSPRPVYTPSPGRIWTPSIPSTPMPSGGQPNYGTKSPYGHLGATPDTGYIPQNTPTVVTSHHHDHDRDQQQIIAGTPWWTGNPYDPWDYWNTGDTGPAQNTVQPPIPPMLPPTPPPPSPWMLIQSAQDTMVGVRQRILAKLEASPEWQQANAAVAQELANLENARQQAKDALGSNPEYTILSERRQKIEQQISRMHRAQTEPSIAVMTPLATEDMQLGNTLKQMQAKLMDEDPGVAAAKQRLAAAQATVESLKKQVDLDVVADPVWQNAQAQLQAARQNLAAGR